MKVLRRFVLLYRGLRSVVRVVEGLKRVGHAEIWTLNPRIWNPEYKRILILAFGTTVSQSVSPTPRGTWAGTARRVTVAALRIPHL